MTLEEYVRKSFESRASSIILKQKLKESDCNWGLLETEWDTYETKLSEMYQVVTVWREARKPIPFWRHWIIGSTTSGDEELDDYPGGEAKEFLIWYFSTMLKECSEETFKFVIGDDDVTR